MKKLLSIIIAVVMIMSVTLVPVYAQSADDTAVSDQTAVNADTKSPASTGTPDDYDAILQEGVNHIQCAGNGIHRYPFNPGRAGKWIFSITNSNPGDIKEGAVVYHGINYGDAYDFDYGIKCEDGGTFEVQLFLNDNVAEAEFDIVVNSIDADYPTITSLTSDENGITIKWSRFDGAASYRVYYLNSLGEWKRFPKDITGTSLVDTGVNYGRKETYTIRALNRNGDFISDFYHPGWSLSYGTDLQTPVIRRLSSDENGITISWNPIAQSSTYRLYYRTSDGGWKRFGNDIKGTSMLDTGVLYGRKETYTIRAINKKGDVMSDFDRNGWSEYYGVDTPQITSLTSDANGINIRWTPVEGASTYRVYYKTSDGGWKRFSGDVKGTTKLDTGISYGRKETYTVRAVNKKGDVMSDFKADGWSAVYGDGIDAPQIKRLDSDENGINIYWDPVEKAAAYRVYYKTADGGWKRFGNDVKGTSMLDTGVLFDRKETYTVRALNNKGDVMSGFSADGWSATYGVDTPQITNLENTPDGIRITWSPVDGASTYRVYYKTADGGWKRFNSDTTGTSRMDTGVRAGRQETYTVRAINKKGDVMSGFNADGWSITYN